jgi:PAS domain S-box-containing protein
LANCLSVVLRRIAFAAIAAIIPVNLAAQPGDVELSADELAWIDQHPVIRVHNETDWPPYNFAIDGEPTGFSVDYIRLVAEKVGLNLEFVTGPTWNEFLEMMRSGELDLMLNVTETDERSEYMLFTEAYSVSSPVFAVQKQVSGVESFDDLVGKTVCLERGVREGEYLAETFPDINLLYMDDMLSCLHAVIDARAFAALDSYSVLNYQIEQRRLPGLHILDLALPTEMASAMRLGVGVDDPLLRDLLEKGMRALDESVVTELQGRWLAGSSAREPEPAGNFRVPLAWAGGILLAAIAVGLLLYVFTRLMKEQGERKSILLLLIVMLVATLGGELYVLKLYVANSDALSEASRSRNESMQLMATLRQSSVELTRMSRSYAATSDVRFKQYFQEILDIRAGNAPRPVNYERVYWDQVVASGRRPRGDGDPIALNELFARAGLTADELAYVRNAEAESNRLAVIEEQAMNALAGRFMDESGNYTVVAEPDPAFARELLYGDDYHRIKAAIMSFNDKASVAVDNRTKLEMTALETRSGDLALLAIPLVILSLIIVTVILLLAMRWMRGGDDAGRLEAHADDGSTSESIATTLLRSWPLFVATAVAVAVVTGLVWRNAARLESDEITDLRDEIATVLDTTSSAADQWFLEREQEARIWARRVVDSGMVEILAAGEAGGQIAGMLDPVVREKGYEGYVVIAADGSIVASSGSDDGIQNQRVRDMLAEALQPPRYTAVVLPTIVGSEDGETGETAVMLFGAGAQDPETGTAIVIAFIVDPEREFTAILQRGRMGQSGESYAFNVDGQLISESRFDDDLRAIGLIGEDQRGILNIDVRDPGGNMTEGYRPGGDYSTHPLTRMAASAVNGVDGIDITGYNDYRGVPVIGAWRWNESIGYGVTTEMDVAEARRPIEQIWLQAYTTIAVVLFLLFGMTALFVRNRHRMSLANRDLTRASEQTRLILENATDGIFTIDDAQRIVRFNPEAERIWGYSASEVLGREMTMLIPEYARDSHLANVHRFRDAEINGIEMKDRALQLAGLTKDGRHFPAEVGISKAEVNGEMQYTAFIKDITERERADRELREAKDAAEAATKAKGDFLANMSHEIRTPMNAVIGLTDLALRTDLTDKQRDYLTKTYNSANALLGIINDILDYSKIEAGRLDIENIEFEIDQVLENLATVSAVKTQEKGLELLFRRDPEIPTVLVGDPLRLGQILINLTNNAVKFTESGQVLVEIEFREMDDEGILLGFSVQDTGIGMTDEQMNKLFESFVQADSSTTRKFGGTGLGLAICKQLVELMGGRIGVYSEPGKGSTFEFTVRLGIGEGAEKKAFTTVPNLRGMHAIVVDDNPTAREILRTYLESFSFRVDEAANSDELFLQLEKVDEPYDLMVLDWLMPGMKGIDIATKIKTEIKPEKDPHIVMVSGFSSGDVLDRPGGEYIDQFLSKPVSPSHLFDAVMAAFGVDTGRSDRTVRSGDFDPEMLRPIQGACLLLVEDNEINQQVARELLEQAMFHVDIAEHGLEALEKLDSDKHDAVLMDMQMPVMDGLTATRKIRADERFNDIPVIAMTANATPQDKDRCLKAGMNDHIAKPIAPRVLFETLLKWVPHGDRDISAFAEKTDDEPIDDIGLPSLPGVDINDGIQRIGGSVAAYRGLLEKFVDNQHEAIGDLRAALADENTELATRLAHTLKGVAGAIGARTLAACAASLETALKANVNDSLDDLIATVDTELGAVMDPLRDWMGDAEPDDAEAMSGELPADFAARLETLLELLDEYDTEAGDVLAQVLKAAKGTPSHAALRPMKKLLDNYDFEAAAELLREELKTVDGAGDE